MKGGREAIVEFNEVEIPGKTRKSFHVLAKNEEGREWSAVYDYDEKGNLHDIDIARGTTSAENEDGRASVRSRVQKNDEF